MPFGFGREKNETPEDEQRAADASQPDQPAAEEPVAAQASGPVPSQADESPASGADAPSEEVGTRSGAWFPNASADEPAPVSGDGGDAQHEEPRGGDGGESDHAPGGEGGQGPSGESDQDEDDGERRGSMKSAAPWESAGSQQQERSEESQSSSRVSVVDEQPPRPAPPHGADEEEYKWHTYRVYPSGRPDAIEFIDVYKAFGRARILRGLNMGLPEGMVSMILGPSGTGKSVCIKHMVGLLYPDEGDVLVHGESVVNMADDDLFEMRKKFGLLFQDGALFGSMNLYDNVAFPLRQHTEKGEGEIEDIVMRRLNEVGLGDAREKMPNELSGGMRKRAGFARALVLEPDIVLFDEPDSGLDPVRTALLGELILEIHRDMMEDAKKKQKQHLPTFCVITHDIMSARRVADYINVLWKGRIVEAGPAEDMLNSDNPFIRQFLSGESQGPLTMD